MSTRSAAYRDFIGAGAEKFLAQPVFNSKRFKFDFLRTLAKMLYLIKVCGVYKAKTEQTKIKIAIIFA